MSMGLIAPINIGPRLGWPLGPWLPCDFLGNAYWDILSALPSPTWSIKGWDVLAVSPDPSTLGTGCSDKKSWNMPKLLGYLCLSLYVLVFCFLLFLAGRSCKDLGWGGSGRLRSLSARMKSWDTDTFKCSIQIHFILQNCPLQIFISAVFPSLKQHQPIDHPCWKSHWLWHRLG